MSQVQDLLAQGIDALIYIPAGAAAASVPTELAQAEGIPVVNGREALICDDWLSMTNEIIALADSAEKRGQLAAAAREFADGLDWFNIAGRYLELFAGIRKQPQ